MRMGQGEDVGTQKAGRRENWDGHVNKTVLKTKRKKMSYFNKYNQGIHYHY